MTRFIYLTDTHWGAGPVGYRVQPKYDVHLPDLIEALDLWIAENGPVDFIVHGGDMVHAADPDSIADAVSFFRRSVPVYHCLGNHDLTERGILRTWLETASELFPGNQPNYTIETTDCRVHVFPNHYHDEPWFWESGSNVQFTDDQFADLRASLAVDPHKPDLLITHSPIYGLPPEQTGRADAFHSPPDDFTAAVTGLADEFEIHSVLGGHNHMNMHIQRNGTHYATASSFVEAPFEFKLLEFGSSVSRMTTFGLSDRVTFSFEYDFDRTYAQGRPCDRQFGHTSP